MSEQFTVRERQRLENLGLAKRVVLWLGAGGLMVGGLHLLLSIQTVLGLARAMHIESSEFWGLVQGAFGSLDPESRFGGWDVVLQAKVIATVNTALWELFGGAALLFVNCDFKLKERLWQRIRELETRTDTVPSGIE